MMRSPRGTWKFAFGVLGVAAVAAAWLFLAPTQVGGSTIYSITDGISMQPLLHKNDLVLLRPQSSYRVGEVVLYDSPILHRPVLHRIRVVQGGHYFFKGDNNDFVDPGYATRAELVGKLWIVAPGVGRVVGWLGKPLYAGLFAALVAVLVLLGGTAPAARRRRGRRREPRAAKAQPVAQTALPVSDGTKATIAAFAVLLLAASIALVVGFTTPRHRIAPLADAYRHTGTYSYTGRTTGSAGAVEYPGGVATTGQPLFTSLIKDVDISFRYRFESQFPHRVHGTIELAASLLAQSTDWQHRYALKKRVPFTGDIATTSGHVLIQGLAKLIGQLSTVAGSAGDTYSVDLQAIVHVGGVVGGRRIKETFSPVLPFSVTATVIKLAVAPATTPPGATYAPPTAAASLAAALDPVQQRSLPQRTANFVSIARYRMTVTAARIAGLTLAVLALLAGLSSVERLRRRHASWPLETQVAAHFGCLLVPVDSLGVSDDSTPVQLHDFESLARLAQYLERPILHLSVDGETYAVDDGSRHYVYKAAAQRTAAPAPVQKPARPRRRLRSRNRLAVLGGIGALLVAATLATSFTASTSVPTTNAGTSTEALQISQLAPGGCGSLSLTSVVLASGATYTNTASKALVLGTSAAEHIIDSGAHNCIVAGGGTDHVNGNTGDYCETGPTTGAKYTSCSTF